MGEPWDTIATVLNWTIWLAFLAELAVSLATRRSGEGIAVIERF